MSAPHHRLQVVVNGAGPVTAVTRHPAESVLVRKTLELGGYAARCSCGAFVLAADELSVRRRFRDHLGAVASLDRASAMLRDGREDVW